MSSALRVEQPSRTWWSLSSKSSKQDLHKQYANDKSSPTIPKSSPTRAFPSFASVIGFKSKKHPTLAIQDPPSSLKPYPPLRHHPDIPPQFRSDHQTRNRLKSAPQPLSPADSVSPLTPVDGFRSERQSLLTLSDADPFASPGIAIHTPSSPNRLSAHSGSSFLDVSLGQDKVSLYVRGSYSSSSSNSYSPQEPQSQGLLRANNSNVELRTLSSSKSLSNLHKKANHVDPEPPLPTILQPQTKRSNPRPSTRPRGMTEVGYTPSPFLQETHSSTSRARRPSSPGKHPVTGLGAAQPFSSPLGPGSQPSSRPSSRPSSVGRTTPNQLVPAPTGMKPQTISRQASIQRLQPPTAPPTHDLPAPPIKVVEEPLLEDELDIPIACNSSISSSSLSFVSSYSSGLEAITSLLDLQKRRERKKSDLDKLSFLARFKVNGEADLQPLASSSKPPSDSPPPTRPLKRTPSLSSLNKRSAQTSNSSSSEPPVEPNKTLRKQRSHHRLPIPPMPLGFKHSHASSFSTPPSPQPSELPGVLSTLEQRRGSTTSNTSVPAPVRKRVFSGTSLRRPSTSSGVPVPPPNEDDARSLFSLRSDHDGFMRPSSFKPWPSSISTFTSFSDDQPPLSPVRSDYTPQRIMSPEEQAKVEAELDDISIASPLPPPTVPLPSARQRTTSGSTVFSDQDSEIIPLSIFSLPLSEPTRSPQVSATKLPKPGAVPMGTPNKSGTSVGRAQSITSKSKSPVASPRTPHRPATSSGTFTFAPMLVIREPEISRPFTANSGTSTAPDTQPAPTSPITPLNIKKNPRKNSNSGTNPPAPQLKSLPPPPRPRAKAQIVTITDSRSDPPHRPSESGGGGGGGGGNRTSIGVDFAHALRHGHVASPSVQSVNPGFSVSSTPATGMNHPPSRPPPTHHHVLHVPPRAVSRPPPPSYRNPHTVVAGPQRTPSTGTSSRRMSLQRKPSFLDIDDDDDAEPESDLDFNAIMRMSSASSGVSFSRSDYTSESFLELGRGSFDTVRSAELGRDNF